MTGFIPDHLVSEGVNTTSNVTVQITHCEASGNDSSFLIGVAMGVFGSVLINIGQNLQASAMQGNPAVQAKPCISRTWVMGLSTFVCGSLLNFLAFTFASASILVPIEAVQFVVNVIYGKYVNKKAISSRMLVGVALTISGTVLCVSFGSSDTRCFTLDEMILFWTQPLWWIYLIISFSVAFGALGLYRRYRREIAAGGAPKNHQYVLPVSFAVSSALLGGGQMIVHSKAIAELFELQVQMIEPLPVTTWYFYLELTLLATGGAFWLYKMNEGIGMFDPLFIIPLLQSCYILFGVIAGGIYFEEFAGLHNGPAGWVGWPLFLLGMGCVLGGLYLIAPPVDTAVGGRAIEGDDGGMTLSTYPAAYPPTTGHAPRHRVHSVDQAEELAEASDVRLEIDPEVAPQPPSSAEGATRHSRTPSAGGRSGLHSRTPSTSARPAEIAIALEEGSAEDVVTVVDEDVSATQPAAANAAAHATTHTEGRSREASRSASPCGAARKVSHERRTSRERGASRERSNSKDEAAPLSPRTQGVPPC